MNIKLYMCYHENYPEIASDIIIPLSGMCEKGCHIALKNAYYSELTAMYWIWKNVKAEVVGLFHYRRFINLHDSATKVHKIGKNFAIEHGLTKQRISELMHNYDVILPRLVPNKVKNSTPTVYEYYAEHHNIKDMDQVLEIIKQKYPAMQQLSDKIIKQEKQNYYANILIAKKELFDEYASWLFDILFTLENKIQSKVLKRGKYQRRVYGFLAERLLRIFFTYKREKDNIKICEAPILYIEDSKVNYIRYIWRNIKRACLKKLGLGKEDWDFYVK